MIFVTYADIGSRDTRRGKPYRPELAAQLDVSLSTLDRVIFEGECAGLWRVEEQTHPGPNGKKVHDANIYHLFDAAFWRGEWTDPLKPDQKAADVAKARLEARRKAKREAGVVHKGGRKRKTTAPEGGGVTGDATSGGGGSFTGEARGGVTGEATVASPVTPNINSPVDTPLPEPATTSVRPSVQEGATEERTDGRTDGGEVDQKDEAAPPAAGSKAEPAAADAAPDNSGSNGGEGAGRVPVPGARVEMTPGAEILYRLGRTVPKLALAGRVLADQAARLDDLLATTPWTRSDLYAALSAPFDGEIRTSPGAVVSARISALPATPARTSLPDLADHGPHGGVHSGAERSSSAAADRSVAEAKTRRVHGECRECGRPPEAEAGGELCAECAGWPLCDRCGIKRVVPGGSGVCGICQEAAYRAPEPEAVCAGHDGSGCGTPLVEIGPFGPLCGQCEIKARRAKKKADAEWEAERAAAVEAAKAAEGTEVGAPF
ncbi:hypothetical protein BKD26_38660 [Streptomyces sp. CB03238]|nr:hypothetical protein BKD26_38660 [Streptomyces sp. CB03238]